MNRWISGALLVLAVTACNQAAQDGPQTPATAITTAAAMIETVEWVETSVGRLQADLAPSVAAETTGRIVQIHFDNGDAVSAGDVLAEIDPEVQQIAVNSALAEGRRLQAQLENERRRVDRLRNLAKSQSVAEDQLDAAVTSVKVLEAQLEQAQARLADAQFNLRQTRITSPLHGRIQRRLIDEGDFVSAGTVVFEIVAATELKAYLPVPEHLSDRVALGQTVRLSIPAQAGQTLNGTISEVRPSVSSAASSIELIVEVENPGGWRSGGSVIGEIILDSRESVVLPPASVVRRPAGWVVYLIDGDRVRQQVVTVGRHGPDQVEIIEGIEPGELVAVDGAGFLTDGARVAINLEGRS